MEIIRKVVTNVDLLKNIFNLLTLQEQIEMTSVCKEFEYIIENFIWKLKFNEIKIIEPDDGYYMGFSDGDDKDYNLTQSEYETFVPLMAKHIRKMVIHKRSKEKLTDILQFENLISLELIFARVTIHNLKSMAINCPKLETVNFINCENVNYSTFDLNKRGQLEALAEIKSLKHLKLVGTIYYDVTQFNEIFNQLCLKSLTLNIHLYSDEVDKVELKNCQALEHLDIDCCYETEAWLQFEDLYLRHFENLTTLSLLSRDSFLRDANMATLAESCKNLRELNLTEWKILIKQFPKDFGIKKLTLKYCFNLTWKNLKQIFGDLQLEEFYSDNTDYEGSADFFYDTCSMSNTLKVIDIKTNQNEEFLEFFKYVNNTVENLKIFRYEFLKNSPFTILKNFLQQCTNLRELFITNVAVPIEDLMQLKSLEIIKFSIFPSITWLYLESLLKHNSLVKISLKMSDDMEKKINNDTKKEENDDDMDLDEDRNNQQNNDDLAGFSLSFLKQNCKKISLNQTNFCTNLQTIKIPLIVFHKQPDMFLDLLNLQKTLKLKTYSYYNPEEMLNQTFLYRLLSNPKFPSRIKYLKILDTYYDVNDLIENFRTTVEDVGDHNGYISLKL